MNRGFEENDELRRLWQELEQPQSNEELRKVMELVETRARTFDRTIYWRNVREYVAAVFVAVIFGWFATRAAPGLERWGHAVVSAGAVWIVLFMWVMQRAKREPAPEASAAAYKDAVLAKYDRQIVLLRHAWAWYVLPMTIGLVMLTLGRPHSGGLSLVFLGVMLAVQGWVAVLNWNGSKKLVKEKLELQRLLESTVE